MLPECGLVLGLIVVASGVCVLPIQTRVAERAKRFRGAMGVAAKDLATGETILVDGDRRFPTASTIKTAVMVEAYHQIAEGRIRADTVVALTEEAKVGEPIVLNHLHAGLPLTISDLVRLMITVSDN